MTQVAEHINEVKKSYETSLLVQVKEYTTHTHLYTICLVAVTTNCNTLVQILWT